MALAEDLRHGTRPLHRLAERSGVVGALLRGEATRTEYVHLMRNLLPAYRALESALVASSREVPDLRALAPRQVFRVEALEADLEVLAGPGFERALPLRPAGARYARRIAAAARADPRLLAAHAYVRYLGDVSGGQILSRLLQRSIVPEAGALGFYRFPAIPSLGEFSSRYRRSLDELGAVSGASAAIVEEARVAFRHNIAVSRACVARRAAARA